MKIKLHTHDELNVSRIEREDLPKGHLKGMNPDDFNEFWVAKDRCGNPYMWAARGYKPAPKEIVVWYRSGNPWASFANAVRGAFVEAAKYAWMSA